MTAPLPVLVLIGVGLIGGSFALDLKRQRLVGRVVGIDTDAGNLERALERGVIDEGHTAVGGVPAVADMVLIATPVAALPEVCRRIAPHLPAHCIVSDVGSTKQSALQAFADCLPRHFPRCVAAHPIAGSDRHGALAAQFGLFRTKKLVLCPHGSQDSDALVAVEALWRAVGAETCRMDAAEHDAVFAAVSHLPHLLAYGYMAQIAAAADRERYLNFAGSGFRDFTRIAASPPAVWTDIALANRAVLLDLLARQQQVLAQLHGLLAAEDRGGLQTFFRQAAAARHEWEDLQLHQDA